MTSVEDDAAMGVALGDATSAGEILALRDELSEKSSSSSNAAELRGTRGEAR